MSKTDLYAMTDAAIADELGQRIQALRLRRNRSQEWLAEAAGLSPTTIKALERGQGKLTTVIAALRALDALENLSAFLPPPPLSPLALARRQGKVRRRASGRRQPPSEGGAW